MLCGNNKDPHKLWKRLVLLLHVHVVPGSNDHQSLGHTPSTQEAKHLSGSCLCLLNDQARIQN